MNGFSQLSFLLFVVFQTLISGKADLEHEEYDFNEFSLRNYDNGENLDVFPELRKSSPKIKGTFFVHTTEKPDGVEVSFDSQSKDIKNDTTTQIVTHGYGDDKEGMKKMIAGEPNSEFLKLDIKLNLLSYSWDFASATPYKVAAKLTHHLGKQLATEIPKLYQYHEIKPVQIHLIGYNLGAHLFGTAGRKQKTKFGRITGLDPARPCFEVPYENVKLTPLSKDDATMVDIVHTNGGGKGVSESYGTSDFFPNGGVIQPQCKDNSKLKSCSSLLSYDYFAKSIRKGIKLWARKCDNYVEFLNKKCDNNSEALFGEHGNPSANGSYFLELNTS